MDESRHSWVYEARCRGKDKTTLIFFPPRDKEQYKVLATQAKAICFGEARQSPCPVREECLWDAVSRDEPHGIWGGLSHRERNALIRKWKKKYKKKMTLKEFIFSNERDR
jgi:WhiB family redox-sensing transcriptional regulator